MSAQKALKKKRQVVALLAEAENTTDEAMTKVTEKQGIDNVHKNELTRLAC